MTAASAAVRRQSIRVALSATLVVAVVYAVIAAGVLAIATVDLTAQVDGRILGALERVPPEGRPRDPGGEDGGAGSSPPPGRDPGRPFGIPFVIWFVGADGSVTTLDASAPSLPAELQAATGPVTTTLDGTSFRIAGRALESGHVVVAQSLEQVADAQRTIALGLLVLAPFLLGSVFAGAVVIGRRVAAPIEAARRRQVDFTADASHELRTPLSVIEAHTSLALAQERDATWYQAAFGRVDRETRRMRRLLEDMLWLARFDAAATPRETEPIDLATLVRQAADRFLAVAETRRLALSVSEPAEPVLVVAAPDLVDRLVGVLLDNACKYAPEGGRVAVTVAGDGGRARLTVDDDGPGVAAEDRDRIFDRFHRSVATSAEAGGAGLGLAIGDAIARATAGRLAVESSPLGGARFTISWPRASLAGRAP
jgi:signal transduction histidine kinase